MKIDYDSYEHPEYQPPKLPDYVPEPKPVSTDYLIGAHYFPGWKQGTHWGWQKVEPYPDRTPLLGYYEEGNPEVADWEIKWALEHGVNFFVYCWYRKKEETGKPMTDDGHRLGHAIHDGLFRSRYGDKFKFAIMWEAANAGVAADEKDLLENLLPYWIDTYFTRPNYLKIDGKPVLFIYSYLCLDRLEAPFGGQGSLAKMFDAMRNAAAKRGVDDLLISLEYRGRSEQDLQRIKQCGVDFAFAYCWHTPQQFPTAAEAIKNQLESIKAWQEAGVLPFIATASMGWDPFPWRRTPEDAPNTPWLHAEKITRWYLKPEQWARLLAEVKNIIDTLPAGSIGRKMLLLDNWNEWGEGHYIAPHAAGGFGHLQAVRQVFTKCDNLPDYRVPAQLNLGPYDLPYRKKIEHII